MPSAVILVIDGLGAKHVGPYGNTWISTPAFNRLATESLLLEFVYAPHASLRRNYDVLWQDGLDQQSDDGLLNRLHGLGVHTRLMTDSAELTEHAGALAFREQMELETTRSVRLAEEWDETGAARFCLEASELIEGMQDNTLLWLHSSGMGSPWDAPFAFREFFADEEDPEPTGSAQVPSLVLQAGYDPDMLHEIQCAFAGQVVLWDRCLDVLHSVIRKTASDLQTLVAVTSVRGFPLGEHLHVGLQDAPLYSELLHVPAFLRYPDGQSSMNRLAGLSEIGDLNKAVFDWFESRQVLSGRPSAREFTICQSANEVLLRSPVWQVRFPSIVDLIDLEVEEALQPELFLKPDDQTDVNDVSVRCADVVDAAREFAAHLLRDSDSVPELPDLLRQHPDD